MVPSGLVYAVVPVVVTIAQKIVLFVAIRMLLVEGVKAILFSVQVVPLFEDVAAIVEFCATAHITPVPQATPVQFFDDDKT